jgi:molybdenum cofactor cytidylyltransferase
MDKTGLPSKLRRDKIGIIILAAGDSSRLGRPKQLLPFGGKTLLAHIVDEALETTLGPVVVVTGASATEVKESLKDRLVTVTHNPNRLVTVAPSLHRLVIANNPRWKEGMASGIVAGLAELLSVQPDSRGVIVAVCDQPHLSSALLEEIMEQFEASGRNLVACSYGGTLGTPVLFGSRYFDALSALSGAEGAKKLLKAYPDDVAEVPFPGGEVDIDTEEDIKKFT